MAPYFGLDYLGDPNRTSVHVWGESHHDIPRSATVPPLAKDMIISGTKSAIFGGLHRWTATACSQLRWESIPSGRKLSDLVAGPFVLKQTLLLYTPWKYPTACVFSIKITVSVMVALHTYHRSSIAMEMLKIFLWCAASPSLPIKLGQVRSNEILP